MSRYNIQREGIVFSDEDCSCNCRNCRDCDSDYDYDYDSRARDDEHKCNNDDDDDEHKANHNCSACRYLTDFSSMFYSLHGIVDYVLFAIERKLELVSEQKQQQQQRSSTQNNQSNGDDKNDNDDVRNNNNNNIDNITMGWFQQHLGPTETSSQWHIKRFVEVEENNREEESINNNDSKSSSSSFLTEEGEHITLPMHTDPSLISIVIHDDSSTIDGGGHGALGLQYYHPRERKWIEPEAHGHSVATIFVGSVLAHLTSGRFPAAKHRVIDKQQQQQQHQQDEKPPKQQRMAATLFVRPQPSALLRVPLPSPWLIQQIQKEEDDRHADSENSSSNNKTNQSKKKKPSSKPPITFDAWLKRVAKNYEKQKNKKKKHIQNTTTT